MKIPKIVHAIGHIDDELISLAENKTKNRPALLQRFKIAVACFATLTVAGIIILPKLINHDTTNSPDENGRYKDFQISESAVSVIWPWEFKTVYEQYSTIEVDGAEYHRSGNSVSDSLLDEHIGKFTAVGYDDINDKKYTKDFDVYTLQNVNKSQFIAVRMENDCYVFKNAEYNPPDTFGKLLDEVNLQEILQLNRFSEKNDGPDGQHYILENDSLIWELLYNCRNAPFVEDEHWHESDREYLSFTITSDTLGVYKRALYITTDGYLWTNAFDWAYIFDIGKDTAEKIITYAKENSSPTEYEPYLNSITGEITEITEEYILVDDSVLCKNPSDGITYKIFLNDLRVSRYVDKGLIDVKDTVQIGFKDKTDLQDENTIDSVVSISRVTISNGNALILE